MPKKTTQKTAQAKPKTKNLPVETKQSVVVDSRRAVCVIHSVKKDYIDLTLANVRLAFPNLAKPRESLDATMKYGAALIIPKSDMPGIISEIKKGMSMLAKTSIKLPLSATTKKHYETAMKLTVGEKVNGQLFRDGNLFQQSNGEIYAGFENTFVMNVQAGAIEINEGTSEMKTMLYDYKIPVKFYNQAGQEIVDKSGVKSLFYAGCYVAARCTISAFIVRDLKKGVVINAGFSRYFSAIRFLQDGESLITRSADFEGIDFSEFESNDNSTFDGDEKEDWEN